MARERLRPCASTRYANVSLEKLITCMFTDRWRASCRNWYAFQKSFLQKIFSLPSVVLLQVLCCSIYCADGMFSVDFAVRFWLVDFLRSTNSRSLPFSFRFAKMGLARSLKTGVVMLLICVLGLISPKVFLKTNACGKTLATIFSPSGLCFGLELLLIPRNILSGKDFIEIQD